MTCPPSRRAAPEGRVRPPSPDPAAVGSAHTLRTVSLPWTQGSLATARVSAGADGSASRLLQRPELPAGLGSRRTLLPGPCEDLGPPLGHASSPGLNAQELPRTVLDDKGRGQAGSRAGSRAPWVGGVVLTGFGLVSPWLPSSPPLLKLRPCDLCPSDPTRPAPGVGGPRRLLS